MREVVIVNGAPGAGKSTLASPLTNELGFPLFSKDVIKETLFDHLGHVDSHPGASSGRPCTDGPDRDLPSTPVRGAHTRLGHPPVDGDIAVKVDRHRTVTVDAALGGEAPRTYLV